MEKNPLDILAESLGVSVEDLMDKIINGLAGVNISHFSDAELQVIKAAIEVAGEF